MSDIDNKVRDGVSAFVTSNDLNSPSCSNCGSANSSTHIAECEFEGYSHRVFHCTNCNNMFTKEQGGVKAFIDNVAKIARVNPNQVSFIQHSNTSTSSSNSLNDNSNDKLDRISRSINSMSSQLSDLVSTLNSIAYKIQTVVEQNNVLQAKLASDPLIGIRERVNTFDLKGSE